MNDHRPDRSGWIAFLVVLLMGLLLLNGFHFILDLLRGLPDG